MLRRGAPDLHARTISTGRVVNDVSLDGVLVVVAVAFVVPVALGLVPSLRLPSLVPEILAGVVIGPQVLGIVEMDDALRVLSLIGLAFLLFLAGLEVDLRGLKGRPLKSAAAAFLLSLAIALALAFALVAVGLIKAPLLVAVILSSTALGIVVPVLADVGRATTPLGQIVIVGSSLADFGAVILLSLLFSGDSSTVGATLAVVGLFFGLAVVVVWVLVQAERSKRLGTAIGRLADSSAQTRVRGAFLLLIGFAALAQFLGLEVILGAFVAGAVLRLLDHDGPMTHPGFRRKLDAVGYGVFVPVFFVASGVQLDVGALLSGATALLSVPVFLLALLLARGLPALLYRPLVGTRGALASGLLQATSLPIVVAATGIGIQLGVLGPATGAALVVAGLLSVMIFPLAAIRLLRTTGEPVQ